MSAPRRTKQSTVYRERQRDTRVGSILRAVPRICDGGFIPSLLAPRARAEQALVAVALHAAS
jgi:transposase-like protein